ncbi:MAG: hypothetical protein FJ303_16690 [Planctomycetes bacterium]|nr:hypothetical protein [Planctomycetota bacterium]
MRLSLPHCVLVVAVVLTHGSFIWADDVADKKLFDKVMDRLVKNELFVKEYPGKYVFPPRSFIKPNSAKEFNAYASAHKAHGAEHDEKAGKIRPVVLITQGFMEKVIAGDEQSLAVIMGHELVLCHISNEG